MCLSWSDPMPHCVDLYKDVGPIDEPVPVRKRGHNSALTMSPLSPLCPLFLSSVRCPLCPIPVPFGSKAVVSSSPSRPHPFQNTLCYQII